MIRFSKFIPLYIIFSLLFLLPGVYSLIRYGLKPSIDFTGGSLVEIRSEQPIPQDTIHQAAQEAGVEVYGITDSEGTTYLIRMKTAPEERMTSFLRNLLEKSGQNLNVLRNESVGPTLGGELLRKTIIAAVLVMAAILLFVAWSFKNITYGVSAIVALVHDLLIIMGMFSIFGWQLGVEVDTLFVTAVLTTMSFSVHDTIVVFDRIREYHKRGERQSFEELTDRALTETMSRSLANSFTIIFMLLALILMGGTTIRWFVVALLIGTISGTYSSPFVATPALLLLTRFRKRRRT